MPKNDGTLVIPSEHQLPVDQEEAELRKALLALQLKQVSKQVKEQEEAENSHKKARLDAALQMEKARKQEEAVQAYCPHKKPNGQSAIVGQRDHQHNYIFLCSYCQKQYNQHTIPPDLRPDSTKIGGPE